MSHQRKPQRQSEGAASEVRHLAPDSGRGAGKGAPRIRAAEGIAEEGEVMARLASLTGRLARLAATGGSRYDGCSTRQPANLNSPPCARRSRADWERVRPRSLTATASAPSLASSARRGVGSRLRF